MLNILLIDDHELLREGIKLLLADLADELVFSEAPTCSTALALADSKKFDIVLLDLHLPDLSGLRALQALRAKMEEAVIVALSAEEDPSVIRQVIEGGAAGFIPKSSSHAIMLAALRLIIAGGAYVPAHALSVGIPGLPHPSAARTGRALSQLTQAQRNTLRLAMQGKSNNVIARELDLSEASVHEHLSASLQTLGLKNRTEAVYATVRAGLKV